MPTSPETFKQVCDRLKKLGYSKFKSVKLYGQVFELVSDPFPDGEEVLVETLQGSSAEPRVIRIPKFIIQAARAA